MKGISIRRRFGHGIKGKGHFAGVGHPHVLAVKLVRGAYMEKEAARAEEKGYENPIHASKIASIRSSTLRRGGASSGVWG